MGLEVDYGNKHKPNSTPTLPLSKLPLKPSEPIEMLTPPLHQSLSVPFRWEVAPGKARSSTDGSFTCGTAAARRLDLPPRLMMLNDDSKNISIMPSPVTVLDGPYVGRSLSLACPFSFRKATVSTGREEGARRQREKRGGARNLGSGRWGSFKEEGKFSLRDAFKNEKRLERRSFFYLSAGINSNIWAHICARFSHAVPWRRS